MMVVQLTIRKISYLNNSGLRCTEMVLMHTMLTEELDSQPRFNQMEPNPGSYIRSLYYPANYVETNNNASQKSDVTQTVFSGIMVQLVYFKYEKHEKYTI